MTINSNRKLKKDGTPVFIERPVPSEKQVEIFERAVKKEARQEEIDENLSEIYRDKEGRLLDVSHLSHEKGSFLLSLIKKLFVVAVLASLAYGFYFYFFSKSIDTDSLDFSIKAPEQVKAGEEFSYTLNYKNKSKFALNSIRLELKYPDNFIVSEVSGGGLETAPGASTKNYFNLPSLGVSGAASVTIKGRMISKKDSANLFSANISYLPGEFSTEFKKEAVTSILVNDLGFDINFEYANAALVGEENNIDLVFSNVKDNSLDDFDVSFMFPENIVLINQNISSSTATSSDLKLKLDKTSSLLWQVSGLAPSDKIYRLPIYYKITKKVADSQSITIRLNKKMVNGKSYVFSEKTIPLNIMNSNLNLTLIVNGSKNDNTTNFDSVLNYSLNYANKSDGPLTDVAIMAVIKGDFLDWSTLVDSKKGTRGENTITWTKEQIPTLANLAPGEEGVIDFSLKLRPYNNSDLGKSFTVLSYAQFNVNNRQGGLNDSKSNNIITKINSDLNLTEKVLYFDENNIPVGSGPLPPQVNQKTSLKVYWVLENNLHELSDTRVVAKLPDYVSFDYKSNYSTGDLSFDEPTHSVVWNIGTLAVSTYQAKAEFNISINPLDSQRNSLLVLLSGTKVNALDEDTKANLEKTLISKTTKLEDDDIAGLNNSGLVQ